MQRDGFTLRVPQGFEDGDGYVHLTHGQQYSIEMINESGRRVDVELTLDGKPVGGFRLGTGLYDRRLSLTGQPNTPGRFTAFARDTVEFQQSALDGVTKDDLGLIVARFRPERLVRPLIPKVDLHQWSNRVGGVTTNAPTYNAGPEPPLTVGASVSEAYPKSARPRRIAGDVQAAGTGLTGQSVQQFVEAPPIEYDPTAERQLVLRIVVDSNAPRPLLAAIPPVPPPVG